MSDELLPLKVDREAEYLGHLIHCPYCYFEFTHINGFTLSAGNDNYEADWPGRGDLIIIPMFCEEGHTWQLCLGFHKGQTYMFMRPDPKRRRKSRKQTAQTETPVNTQNEA